jgi:hypothetical protein
MHCELLVPGLLATDAGARLPALELLLARGRRADSAGASLEAWLAEGFGLEAGPLPAGIPIGALTLLASGRDPGSASWARADPVHLRLLRDRMVIVPAAAFALSGEEAAGLCETLNAHFAGRLEIEPAAPERWCARLAAAIALDDASPLDVAGRVLAPGKADALLNEIQMVLHEHPVNEAREARGEPAVNSLWLWGAGPLPRGASGPWQSVTSDEPASLGLARATALRSRPLPASADAWLDRLPEDGRHLVVLDSLRAPLALSDPALPARLLDLEAKWFAPLLAALRAGRIGMLTVHVPDAGASWETIRADLRRFWKRPKPLARWMRAGPAQSRITP